MTIMHVYPKRPIYALAGRGEKAFAHLLRAAHTQGIEDRLIVLRMDDLYVAVAGISPGEAKTE